MFEFKPKSDAHQKPIQNKKRPFAKAATLIALSIFTMVPACTSVMPRSAMAAESGKHEKVNQKIYLETTVFCIVAGRVGGTMRKTKSNFPLEGECGGNNIISAIDTHSTRAFQGITDSDFDECSGNARNARGDGLLALTRAYSKEGEKEKFIAGMKFIVYFRYTPDGRRYLLPIQALGKPQEMKIEY